MLAASQPEVCLCSRYVFQRPDEAKHNDQLMHTGLKRCDIHSKLMFPDSLHVMSVTACEV